MNLSAATRGFSGAGVSNLSAKYFTQLDQVFVLFWQHRLVYRLKARLVSIGLLFFEARWPTLSNARLAK